jgi:hypothetical protein
MARLSLAILGFAQALENSHVWLLRGRIVAVDAVPSTNAILLAVVGYVRPSDLFAHHFRDHAYDTGG